MASKQPTFTPVTCLLMSGEPTRQLMKQHPPGSTGSHDVEQTVEEIAQGMITLLRIFSHQAQIGRTKGPFLITDIAEITDGSFSR
jgi:hypothetical protein